MFLQTLAKLELPIDESLFQLGLQVADDLETLDVTVIEEGNIGLEFLFVGCVLHEDLVDFGVVDVVVRVLIVEDIVEEVVRLLVANHLPHPVRIRLLFQELF